MVDDHFKYGAIIKLSCSPSAGHEQNGWRPAIIISNDDFNATNNMRVICPITHTDRQSPYHIPVTGCDKTDGYVMCDQMRSVDPRARKAEYVEQAADELIEEVNTLAKDCL